MATSNFNPSFCSLSSNLNHPGLSREVHLRRFVISRKVFPSVLPKKFELHCSIGRDMDARPCVLVDDVPESLNGMESNKEPSVSIILLNFENPFDPYGASSTPLYQTATFKQGTNLHSRAGENVRNRKVESWKPPPRGWIKANINASILPKTNKAGMACIVRNSTVELMEAMACIVRNLFHSLPFSFKESTLFV